MNSFYIKSFIEAKEKIFYLFISCKFYFTKLYNKAMETLAFDLFLYMALIIDLFLSISLAISFIL